MVATDVENPLPVAVKAGILPEPLACKPIKGAVFVQVNVVPLTGPLNAMALVTIPLHNDWFGGCTTLGVGFTVIVNDWGKPAQPIAEGVTVIAATSATLVVLIARKAAIFPEPLAGKPMEVLLLAQA